MTVTAIRIELRRRLDDRLRKMQDDVQSLMYDEGAERQAGVRDDGDQSDADVQDDLELALLRMGSETLSRIDDALGRLEFGTYGVCFECALDISEERLQAMPFALRCDACDERREQAHRRPLQHNLPLVPEAA
jgi:DnaK suppressor protein